jgi:hypothetical protein
LRVLYISGEVSILSHAPNIFSSCVFISDEVPNFLRKKFLREWIKQDREKNES